MANPNIVAVVYIDGKLILVGDGAVRFTFPFSGSLPPPEMPDLMPVMDALGSRIEGRFDQVMTALGGTLMADPDGLAT